MTVERMSSDSAEARQPAGLSVDDISGYSMALASDTVLRAQGPRPSSDPLMGDIPEPAFVAPGTVVPPTVRSPRLTAILVAEDGRVAVIDDDAVSVGSRLKTGERVASIQQDRVWVVKPNGEWKLLTLDAGAR